MGLSSVQYLKEIFPKAEITYGISERAYPVFKDYSGDNIRFCPLNYSVSNWYKEYKFIKSNKFDLIIELQQRGRTKKFFKIYKLIGNTNYYYFDWRIKNKNFIIDEGIEKPVIQKDLDCIWSSIKHFTKNTNLSYPNYLDYSPKFYLKRLKPKTYGLSVILGISAGVESRIWDINNFRELIFNLSSKFKDIFFLIPIEPVLNYKLLEKEILSWNFSNIKIVTTNLSEIPYDISECSYYIGNDTGIKHISIAIGMKSLTLFGEAPPSVWHPYDKNIHKYISKGNINDIRPEEVIKASIEILI